MSSQSDHAGQWCRFKPRASGRTPALHSELMHRPETRMGSYSAVACCCMVGFAAHDASS